MRPDQLTADRVMIEVDRVVQSNDTWLADDFDVHFIHAPLPAGNAWSRSAAGALASYLGQKKCIIQIKNKDSLCCARAIVTAKAHLDGHEKWHSIRQGLMEQRYLAKALHRDAGKLRFRVYNASTINVQSMNHTSMLSKCGYCVHRCT